jgi:hypothetical protein
MGRAYARQRVIPNNPQSAAQSGVRAMMKFLSQEWASLGSTPQGTYEAAAEARNISAYNQYISENLARWQMFLAPSKSTPAAEASSGLTVTTLTTPGGQGGTTIEATPSGDTSIWGIAIFRATAEITTPNWSNCVKIIPANGSNAVQWTDSPLEAGTYHYRAAVINDDGVMGTVKADQTAVVT